MPVLSEGSLQERRIFFCPSFANARDGFIVSFPVYFQGMSGWQPGRSEVVTGSRSVSHQGR